MNKGPYTFTLVIEGRELSDADLERLHAGGFDDAAFGHRGNEQIALFDREAETLASALLKTIWQIEKELPGVTVARIEPDDLVTMARIAERTERSRESIRQLVAGERGSGDFPRPVSWVGGASRVWRWSEVEEWFDRHRDHSNVSSTGAQHFIAALNGVLETRRRFAALAKIAAEDPPSDELEFTKEDVEALPTMLAETVRTVSRRLTTT